MEEQHFNKLSEAVSSRLEDTLQQKPGSLRDRVRREFGAVRDNGELLTLSRDEARLIFDYRLWKASSSSVSGVFHWKKPSAKILEPEEN